MAGFSGPENDAEDIHMNEKEIDTVPAEPNHGGPQDEDLTIQEDAPVKKEKKKMVK